MADYMQVPGAGGWYVATDGGRNRVVGIHAAPGSPIYQDQLEKIARLVARAMEMPGGVEAAISALVAAS